MAHCALSLFSNEGSREPNPQSPLVGGLLACPVVAAWNATIKESQT